jgi:hypothetical protein
MKQQLLDKAVTIRAGETCLENINLELEINETCHG